MVIRRCVTPSPIVRSTPNPIPDIQSLLVETNGDAELATNRILEGACPLLSLPPSANSAQATRSNGARSPARRTKSPLPRLSPRIRLLAGIVVTSVAAEAVVLPEVGLAAALHAALLPEGVTTRLTVTVPNLPSEARLLRTLPFPTRFPLRLSMAKLQTPTAMRTLGPLALPPLGEVIRQR